MAAAASNITGLQEPALCEPFEPRRLRGLVLPNGGAPWNDPPPEVQAGIPIAMILTRGVLMKLKSIVSLLLVLFPVIPFADAAPADEILREYYVIQKSLAADSTGGVAAAAQKIATLSGQAARSETKAKTQLLALSSAAAALRAHELNAARLGFGELSMRLTAYLQAAGPRKIPPYQFFCPMAHKGWLQADKDTHNPYYGSSMLKCGDLIQ